MIKSIICILLYLCCTYCYSQCNCTSFWTDKNPKQHLWIDNDSLFINKEGEDISSDMVISGNVIFKGKCFIKKDTLIVIKDRNKHLFKILDDGVIKTLFKINGYIKQGDIFLCSRYEYRNGDLLLGSAWKNSKKEGVWIYKTNEDKLYRLTYKNGEIVKKEFLKNKQDSTDNVFFYRMY